MVNDLVQHDFCCVFDTKIGHYRIEVWPISEGFELSVTHPNDAAERWIYANGKPRSCTILGTKLGGSYPGIDLIRTIYRVLSPEEEEMAQIAVKEFCDQRADSEQRVPR
jgi:hypothetical protein